jgi:hypothetical protein
MPLDDRKRYQVFVSSTFRDLQAARQEVTLRLLEADAFPAGMELFPATSEDAWTLIRGVIDESDYYLLIVAGRYGSIDEENQLSYTEMEYNYASAQGKHVMAFLHGAAGDIPVKLSETTDAGNEKLTAFRKKIEKERHVKYWTSTDQLGGQVAATYNKFIRMYPAVGWMRADTAAEPDALRRIADLQAKVEELSGKLAKSRMEPPPGTEDLAQGSDETTLDFDITVSYRKAYVPGTLHVYHSAERSWDEIFAAICPKLLDEALEEALKEAINSWALLEFWGEASEDLIKAYNKAGINDRDVDLIECNLDSEAQETIILQFLALGLIANSEKKRSLTSKGTYWTLTPFGRTRALQLRAQRKSDVPGASLPEQAPEALPDTATPEVN